MDQGPRAFPSCEILHGNAPLGFRLDAVQTRDGDGPVREVRLPLALLGLQVPGVLVLLRPGHHPPRAAIPADTAEESAREEKEEVLPLPRPPSPRL